MPQCRTCHKAVVECKGCKGHGTANSPLGTSTCTSCKGTGYVCPNPNHGKQWNG